MCEMSFDPRFLISMYYYIYKITNNLNGRFYIGKHQTTNLNDGYMGSGIVLRRAFRKYGIENFKKDILYFCKDKFEMNAIEEYILTEDFIKQNDVYNIAIGGQGGNLGQSVNEKIGKKSHERIVTDEARRNYSIASKGRKLSKETRLKMSLAKKGKPSSFKGKHHSDASKRKIQKSVEGFHWYTNGFKNVQGTTCPSGFRPGRTKVP